MKTFQFNSDLKRMSVLVRVEGFDGVYDKILVTKGAPEMIYQLLKNP